MGLVMGVEHGGMRIAPHARAAHFVGSVHLLGSWGDIDLRSYTSMAIQYRPDRNFFVDIIYDGNLIIRRKSEKFLTRLIIEQGGKLCQRVGLGTKDALLDSADDKVGDVTVSGAGSFGRRNDDFSKRHQQRHMIAGRAGRRGKNASRNAGEKRKCRSEHHAAINT